MGTENTQGSGSTERTLVGDGESAGWLAMEDFAAGIDTNRIPSTGELAGGELDITLDGGGSIHLDVADGARVRWRVTGVDWAGEGEDDYDAVPVGEGAYWVDITLSDRKTQTVTLVFHPVTGWALAVHSEILDEGTDHETRIKQTFHPGAVGDGSSRVPRPAPTRDLIGKRTLFRYSANHLYEHIYLSSRRFVWHNLIGEQRGHAAAELATTYKLEDGLYLFMWREEKIPVGTVFVFDYARGRSTGKFIGLTSEGRVENNKGGAEIIPFGESDYGEYREPV